MPPSDTKKAFGIAERLGALDWAAIAKSLDDVGLATTGPLLTAPECTALKTFYADDSLFRSRIVMARHGFGSGEYKYFSYPLPGIVGALRAGLYPPLARIANAWFARMGKTAEFPPGHTDFVARCHA